MLPPGEERGPSGALGLASYQARAEQARVLLPPGPLSSPRGRSPALGERASRWPPLLLPIRAPEIAHHGTQRGSRRARVRRGTRSAGRSGPHLEGLRMDEVGVRRHQLFLLLKALLDGEWHSEPTDRLERGSRDCRREERRMREDCVRRRAKSVLHER